MSKLRFVLDVTDGWPPVAIESLHVDALEHGYRICSIPFFVPDLAADDVIEVLDQADGQVWRWRHLQRAPRSTVWVMQLGECDLASRLRALVAHGCRYEGFPSHALFALDVPFSVAAATVDEQLGGLGEDVVALAWPAWRHPEDD